MKGTNLGEFEELVLLAVGIHHGNAYGFNITTELQEQTGRNITLSTVHTALYRLEKKGYVNSELGGASASRGGRRKRIFTITNSGYKALEEAKAVRMRLWNRMPDQGLNPGLS